MVIFIVVIIVVTVIDKCDIAMCFKVVVGIRNKVNETVSKSSEKHEAKLA